MITGRLLLISGGLDSSHRFTRVLAMLALFLFSTTAVFVAVMRVEKLEERTKRRKLADIRFMPKCVQTLHSLSLSRARALCKCYICSICSASWIALEMCHNSWRSI